MNYATSCVDFMHAKAPLHDGIAHGLTAAERAKLLASGSMAVVHSRPLARGGHPKVNAAAREIMRRGASLAYGGAKSVAQRFGADYRSVIDAVVRLRGAAA